MPSLAAAASNRRALFALVMLGLLLSGCATQGAHERYRYTGDRNYDNGRNLSESNTLGISTSSRRHYSGGDAAIEDALHQYYQQWQGVPYRYGGRGTDGIDCSSFVRQTLGAIEALDLPRTTDEQAVRGQAIDRQDLSPGDLVFFKTGGADRHVGVYVGNGRFMHASTSKGVTISRLDNVYWRDHYWQSRRVTSLTN